MIKNTFLFVAMAMLLTSQKPKDQGLKDVFEDSFYIGVALNSRQVAPEATQEFELISTHFNSLSPENGLKWALVHPQPETYNFEFGDEYVAMGEKLGAFTIGHCLIWHQQVPNWVFENESGEMLDKDALISRMEAHIETVMGRYKGKIKGWDVVNEAFNEDGSFRESKWYKIAGKDFIKAAFRKANEVDPEAELYYNDYNVWRASKRKGILDFVKEMKAEGIRITAIGMQGHYTVNGPSIEEIEQGILDIYEAGFKVAITELDVDVLPRPRNSEGADLNINYANSPEFNPYKDGITPEGKAQLANRYGEIFKLFEKHKDKINRVTFWGLYDGRSWLNNFPVRGRTNYPLPIDRDMKLKEDVFNSIKMAVEK
ncbi:endo-1,4-beta-xylanase [Algoriphagus pacificus]|uniref:Beta-xylanase n=1 Tax=Algoriphagus pacificus TaxID=2811234 RepID=A0ABS3CKU1_9BACT|nr:endo-1,4-beta-xylanase [Algoriphagus pacificus]MBN7817106.1 endo-1,4-beta-xylanase [Algoriphagus pacificus]